VPAPTPAPFAIEFSDAPGDAVSASSATSRIRERFCCASERSVSTGRWLAMALPPWVPGALLNGGYESQFATNHLGHFQLTARLWEALSRANGARVVSVSSLGHRYSPVVFDDPNFEHREYDPWAAYGQSKTANILFAVELDKRGQDAGVRAFSLHPAASPGPASNGTSPGRTSRRPGSSTRMGTPSSTRRAT
jgi:NAD(P)-dependent dehydrogenase (short-subunit alcohol dehydrogenase family)